MDKEKSIIPFREAESTTGDHQPNIPISSIVYPQLESTTLHFVNTNPNQLQNW
jgi:hypothetical protein